MRMIDFGISHSKIDVICITHLHGDHFFGIFGLLTSMSLNQRQKDLIIVGPPDLEDIVNAVVHFNKYPLPFSLEFVKTQAEKPSVIFEDKWVTISTVPLTHRIETTGYILREKQRPSRISGDALESYNVPIDKRKGIVGGDDFIDADGNLIPNKVFITGQPKSRSFAFCTDTKYKPDIVAEIKGVDILYHEATFLEDEIARANETNHSTARQAGQIASQAEVGKLLIGHWSARYINLDPHLLEAKEIFPETYLAIEGRTFEVPYEIIES